MKGKPPSEASPAGAVSLRVLISFLILFGVGLYEVVGLPHGPTSGLEVPDAASVEAILRSSRPPLDGAIYVSGMFGWLVWAWLVLSLILQVGVAVAERLAGGTAFVQRAHGIADLLSAPVVRQAVQASVAGGMLVRVALAGVPVAAAAPTGTTAFMVDSAPAAAPWRSGEPGFWAAPEHPVVDAPPGSIVYTVQPGDNLVGIAERFYDDGDKWQLVYEANQGRSMADGRTFDRAGVIQPGWQLIVPDPTATIETDADGQRWYTVRRGDSLAAISARLLGNEQRWPELFAANQGVRLDDRRVLQDPRLIWPGLVLRIPELDVQPSTQPQGPSESDARETMGTSATQTESPTPTVLPVAPAIRSGASNPTPTVVEKSENPPPIPVVSSTSIEPTDIATTAPDQTSASQARLVPPAVGAVAGATVAVAGVAGTALVLRRRHRKPGRMQPESDVAVNAGYAEAEPTDEFSSNTDSDDLSLAMAIAERMSREVAEVLLCSSEDSAELPLDGAMLAAVRHGRSSTTLFLQRVPMAARQRLIEALPEAATRAFGSRSDVEGMVSVDGDVLVRLTGVVDAASYLGADAPRSARRAWSVPSTLLRMGLLADRQVFAASWEALSHVLVAAPSGRGAEVVLEALVASLIARRSPAELGLIVIGRPHSLPDELLGVPHMLEPRVDPHDEAAALALMQLVRREMDDRMSDGRTDQPDIVVVVPELTDLSAEHCATLSAVMLHGPRYGVRVLAASDQRAADLVRDCPLVPEFGTRLVLRAADEEESMALLGSGDAIELGTGGHMLVRLEGRVPLQGLAYRVAPDRLAHLATLIREHAAPADWWMSQGAEQNSPESSGAAVETEEEDAPDADAGPLEPRTEQSEVAAVAAKDKSVDDTGEFDSAPELDGVAGPAEVQCELPLEVETELEACESIDVSAVPNGNGAELEQRVTTTSLASSSHGSNETAALPPPGPKLQARFLGARELLYDGKIVWPVAGVPDEAAMELLVFLGVEDPAGVRADMLSDSLWEEDDEDDEDRSYRLRKRRYRLRRALKRLIPGWQGDPIARMDKQTPIYRLDPNVIETDVHCFLKLLEDARSLSAREEVIQTYEHALELYRGDLLDRPDVPSYRWLDDGPRVLDLRVKYATFHQLARRRLADLLVSGGTDPELARAEELYKSLVTIDALDHRLWEALARLHGARNDLLGLEATFRRLKNSLVEVGEGDDPERVPVPPTLKRIFEEVRARLLAGRD